MAQGKKKEKELTIEEQLEQALVPVEEQPYEVPENWCWTSLKYVANIFNGDRGINYPSKKDYQTMGIPFINAGAIVDGELCGAEFHFISEEKYNSLRAGKIKEGDILYCLRGSLGKTAIIRTNQKGAISSSLCILRKKKIIHNRYLYYLLCSDLIKKQQDSAENGSAQPNLSAASVTNYFIPVAPTHEQQRIVDRIESLFAKLDEAKEKAQAVVDGFETRKAAILHKAFTGELTAQWRNKTGLGRNTWRKKPLKDICKYMRAGGDKPQDFSNNKDKAHQIPVVANGISDDGIIGFTGVPKEEGDSVTISGRGTIGFSVYRDYPYYPVVRLIVLAPQKYIRGLYLKYYFDAFPENGTGSSIPQLTVPMIKEKQVLFPTLAEQDIILETTDILVKKEQQAKETAETVLEQIEAMKKSILARAFRGELGTNAPAEESGVELLKRVL